MTTPSRDDVEKWMIAYNLVQKRSANRDIYQVKLPEELGDSEFNANSARAIYNELHSMCTVCLKTIRNSISKLRCGDKKIVYLRDTGISIRLI